MDVLLISFKHLKKQFMRSVFILSLLIFTVFSCAKKTVPAATTENKTVSETKAPDEIKTATTTLTESSTAIAGHETFNAKCGRCHGLKNPSDYTVEQWKPILDKMAPRARLDSTEKANVFAYVSFYAKPGN
jgi:hypothetical protein